MLKRFSYAITPSLCCSASRYSTIYCVSHPLFSSSTSGGSFYISRFTYTTIDTRRTLIRAVLALRRSATTTLSCSASFPTLFYASFILLAASTPRYPPSRHKFQVKPFRSAKFSAKFSHAQCRNSDLNSAFALSFSIQYSNSHFTAPRSQTSSLHDHRGANSLTLAISALLLLTA